MKKKHRKMFAIFWLVSGIIWTIAIIRHVIVMDDIIGAVIYIFAAIISFIISFAYYKNFIK